MQAVPLFCKFFVPNLGHGCTSCFFSFCPAIQSFECHLLWLRNQIVGRAFTKHPDALLHPQSPVVTLLWRRCNFFGDGSSTCGLPYRGDTTTGSDRITKQAGRNHRIRTHSNTHAHTLQQQQNSPKVCSLHEHPDGTIYHSRTAANLITITGGI